MSDATQQPSNQWNTPWRASGFAVYDTSGNLVAHTGITGNRSMHGKQLEMMAAMIAEAVNAYSAGEPRAELPKPINYDLWRHLHDEHGLTLLQSELDEILRLAQPLPAQPLCEWCGGTKDQHDDPSTFRPRAAQPPPAEPARAPRSITDPDAYLSEPPAVPDELFNGYEVYHQLSTRAKARTSSENVSDVLDTVVRMIRARATATKEESR